MSVSNLLNSGNVNQTWSHIYVNKITAGTLVVDDIDDTGEMECETLLVNSTSVLTGDVSLGGSLDKASAAGLNIGGTNATTLGLSRTGQLTQVKGGLQVDQASLLTGNVSLAGTLDKSSAAALDIGGTNCTTLGLSRAGQLSQVKGGLQVDQASLLTGNVSLAGTLDKSSAAALDIGGTNCTTLGLSRAGQLSQVKGGLQVDQATLLTGNVTLAGTLDKSSAAALAIGGTNATSLAISRAGQATTVNGSLTSSQAFTASTTSALVGVVTMGSGGTSYTLPVARGTANQVLTDNGSGVVSFAATNRGLYQYAGDLAANPFAIAGGLTTTAGAAAEGPSTQFTGMIAGTITRLGFRHGGDATTAFGIYINFVQSGANIVTGGTAGTVACSVAVALGDFISIGHVAGTNPGNTRLSIIVT